MLMGPPILFLAISIHLSCTNTLLLSLINISKSYSYRNLISISPLIFTLIWDTVSLNGDETKNKINPFIKVKDANFGIDFF